jgi:CheY-like chemotaxis protein
MNYKILIVEDEAETSKYLSSALTDEGFIVEIAENGIIGLEKLKQSKYNLIVLDLKMPGKTGDEVLKDIREIDPYIHVVINTNYAEPQIMQKLINLGVDGYCQKGATADLWTIVDLIKSKLETINEDQRKDLIDKLVNHVKKNEGNEISS